ncbi:hypothetical protein Daudx_0620 [Candidatus Desulforudis audaxviator]|nr:hypothetical protein Daudx_0620 [Candidatus Desulforudis audaxviator]
MIQQLLRPRSQAVTIRFKAAILQSYLKVRALVSLYIKMRAGAS